MAAIAPVQRIDNVEEYAAPAPERSVTLFPMGAMGSWKHGAYVHGCIGFVDDRQANVDDHFAQRFARVFRGSPAGLQLTLTAGKHTITTTSDSSGRFFAQFPANPGRSEPEAVSLESTSVTVAAEQVTRSWAQRWLGWLPGISSFSHMSHPRSVTIGEIPVSLQCGSGRKLLTISDIDGTALRMQIGQTLREGTYDWSPGMQGLLKEMEKYGPIAFVTGSPVELAPELHQRFQTLSGLRAEGGIWLKNWYEVNPKSQAGHKLHTIFSILSGVDDKTSLVLIGDDPEMDPWIYDTVRKILRHDLDEQATQCVFKKMGVEKQFKAPIQRMVEGLRDRDITIAGIWIRSYAKKSFERPPTWPAESKEHKIHYVPATQKGANQLLTYFKEEVLSPVV